MRWVDASDSVQMDSNDDSFACVSVDSGPHLDDLFKNIELVNEMNDPWYKVASYDRKVLQVQHVKHLNLEGFDVEAKPGCITRFLRAAYGNARMLLHNNPHWWEPTLAQCSELNQYSDQSDCTHTRCWWDEEKMKTPVALMEVWVFTDREASALDTNVLVSLH